MNKEAAVSKLLGPPQQGTANGRPLIVDLSAGDVPKKQEEEEAKQMSEGPTMLELMMEAQKSAKKEKEEARSKAAAKEPLAKGFKKGFFNSKPPSKKADSKKPDVKKTKPSDEPVLIKAKTQQQQKGVVLDEVQKAMDDQNPILQQLKKNEWVTQDLMGVMQSNEVLSRGMKDPECMAAMQLLQSDPQAAKKRFENNPRVTVFLQEFGKIMASHFESLGSSASGNSGSKEQSGDNSSAAGSSIQEIGPLQAKALEKAKAVNEPRVVELDNNLTDEECIARSVAKEKEAEEAKVQKILQDEELRAMLMDPNLQQILLECGDPIKFQQHMRNPETARKIMRLKESGLVSQQS